MTSITYIGMDVHTTNYTICAFQIDGEKVFGQTTINPDVKELVKYLTRLKERLGKNTKFICGYEAGCLGYTLYHDLKGLGYESPRVRIALTDFSPDDAKTAGNTLCINEDFGKIWRKRCKQAVREDLNRL